MYSWLVTVLLLASATNGSGGAQVPITNYTCTQPNQPGFLDQGRCTVSGELRTCAIAEGASLDGSINIGGTYVWNGSTNPFVVLDIPQGWCVKSVEMTFGNLSIIPDLNLSVHSAERLSTNTDRTVFSLVSEAGTRPVVMNLTALARGKYLRINMTSTEPLYLKEIEVFGTNDSICTHPFSAGGDPASPTTSVTPASPTTSVTPASPTTSATAIRAQVPITSYTCTQPNLPTFTDNDQCTASRGLRTCTIKEGARPTLLSSSADLSTHGFYTWDSNRPPYPNITFVVLDIPQGWCVGSVKMTFVAPSTIPALSLSVHSAERLSTNTDRTMFSLVSEEGTRLVVMNLTTLACGKYLRINMTSTGRLFLREIKVFGTNDSICTHPSSAGGDPASPTTSVTPASPTTSVSSSTNSVMPITGTSDYSTTSISTPSPSPSLTPGGVPVAPDSYVQPAAISVVAVLLVVVLTAIFVVVICIITRRHKTRKSLDTQRLSSILYRSTQSDVTFEDKFHTGKNDEVSIHDANGSVDKDHNSDIGETTHSYGALGPSESTGAAHIVQGAAEEPVAEGAISRPTSQASIRSNEVSSKPTHGMVVQAHPSMLDHPYDSCNWENTTVGCDGGGHNETSLNYQHAEGLYDLPPDYKLTDQEATADDSHKVLQNDKGTTTSQVGTTHQPPPQAPLSVLPTVESAYADTIAEAPEKRREPSPCSPTYDSVDPPSSTAMPAAAQSSKQHSSRPKPSPSAKSPRVPHEDHIYSEVDKSRKKSASSTSSPPAHLTHTSSTTAKGAVPTQEATMDHVYAAVDYSKKKLRRGKKN